MGRVTVVRRGVLVRWRWDKARIAPVLSRPEARFWYAAMTKADDEVPPDQFGLYLARQPFDKDPPLSAMLHRLRQRAARLSAEIVLPLANLLPLEDLVGVLAELGDSAEVVDGFRRFVLPYLTEEERHRMRSKLRLKERMPDPYGNWPAFVMDWRLASLLGVPDAALDLAAGWRAEELSPAPCPASHKRVAYDVLYGLGSTDLVRSHFRRLQLGLHSAEHVRFWLAHTEWHALDAVHAAVVAHAKWPTAEEMLDVLTLVRAPEAAPVLLDLRRHVRTPTAARRWLEEHVGNAVAGLLPVGAGKGQLAEDALEYLRETRQRGFCSLIEERLSALPVEDAARIRRAVFTREQEAPALDVGAAPAWLAEALAAQKEKAAAPPEWAAAVRLPPLTVGDFRLGSGHVAAVLSALRGGSLTAPSPLIRALKKHLDPAALEAFAWKLFELWLAEGADPKDRWALAAVGVLGGGSSALKLAPLVRDWPSNGFHERAAFALECLRTIGNDTALLQLSDIARKVKSPALQEKARTLMDAIAADRRLSRAQLEDRIVPDLGLDERGSRLFDFGPRRFRLDFGADLRPRLRDEAGKRLPGLPRPNSKDDAGKTAATVRDWDLFKKELKLVVKVQAKRLEKAMLTCRRWSVAEFDTFLVRHPFLRHMTRLLLWGLFDAEGQVVRAFRVGEDGGCADVDDRNCVLERTWTVGVVHPLHLSDAERSRWGEVFGDYEIIPPFPQLSRRVHRLLPGEDNALELTRFGDKQIPEMLFFGILKSHGWVQCRLTAPGRGVSGHLKHYAETDLTAILEQKYVAPGFLALQRTYFVAGQPEESVTDRLRSLPLGKVEPVTLSEVIGTLAVLASKGV
jgi:hypothetical protein